LDVFDRDPASPGSPGGGWWVLVEPELHFGHDVLVPDLAAWRRERLPRIPNAPAISLAPDWVCEVISPSTGRLDRSRKMTVYAREGIAYLWIVDPLQHTLEIYRLEAGRWVVAATRGGWETVRAAPFEAIVLDITRLLLDPPPAA
jgi:Uma2 family endonuclease